VQVLHVESEDTQELRRAWDEDVERPLRAAGLPLPELVVLKSPYRYVIHPILDYVLLLERELTDRMISVVIPHLVERRWFHYFLHNQRGELLAALLLVKGDRRIAIVSVPWYLAG